jgi:hypothetical protein
MKLAPHHPLALAQPPRALKTAFAFSGPPDKLMSPRLALAVGSLLIAAAVVAQTAGPAKRPVLGKAINVQGLVTVSDANGVSRVVSNNDVIDRNRYVTSSTGYVTLKLDKGCDIELKPNQALTVEDEKSCEVLWASIESLGNPAGALLAGGGGGGAAGGAAAGVVAGGGGASLVPFVIDGAAILLMGGGGSGTPTKPDDGSGNPGPCGGNLTDCISPQ